MIQMKHDVEIPVYGLWSTYINPKTDSDGNRTDHWAVRRGWSSDMISQPDGSADIQLVLSSLDVQGSKLWKYLSNDITAYLIVSPQEPLAENPFEPLGYEAGILIKHPLHLLSGFPVSYRLVALKDGKPVKPMMCDNYIDMQEVHELGLDGNRGRDLMRRMLIGSGYADPTGDPTIDNVVYDTNRNIALRRMH